MSEHIELDVAPFTAAEAGKAACGHWMVENSLHSVLDVVFDEDP